MENNSASIASRNSPIASAPNAFPWFLTVLALVGMAVVFLLVLFAGVLQFLLTHGGDVRALLASANGMWGVRLQAIAELLTIAYLAFVVPALAGTTLSGLGFRRPDRRTAAYICGGVVAMFLLVTLTGTLFTNLFHVKAQEEAVHLFLSLHTLSEKIQFAVFAAILAPVWEEAIFRIFLFNAMHKWWGFWPAAVTSSILFGLAHIQPPYGIGVLAAICLPLALGGLVLCWIYATTRNAWGSVLTHGLFNFISTALLFVAPQLAK